jgi:6-phosphogluconolactonase
MERSRRSRAVTALGGGVLLAATLAVAGAVSASADSSERIDRGGPAKVYTISNAPSSAGGNAVLAFRTTAAGGLAPAGSFSTAGSGSGAGLGSQGALALAGSHLVVVNAGSNTVSAFSVRENGLLRLLGSAPSGGTHPISVTLHGQLVYVLNDGDNTVSGLRLREDGLTPITGSTRSLSAGAHAPVQVSFTPDGGQVVVAEKLSNTIDTFAAGSDGRLGPARTNPSTGSTPFGFDFDAAGHLVDSDAFGGAGGASALTSYRVGETGQLQPITLVPDGQSAACWVVIDRHRGHVYTTNTGSGTVSSYDIDRGGRLTLRASVATTTGGSPGDVALAAQKLFVLDTHGGRIFLSHVRWSGDLSSATLAVSGLPTGTTGLVAAGSGDD